MLVCTCAFWYVHLSWKVKLSVGGGLPSSPPCERKKHKLLQFYTFLPRSILTDVCAIMYFHKYYFFKSVGLTNLRAMLRFPLINHFYIVTMGNIDVNKQNLHLYPESWLSYGEYRFPGHSHFGE